MSEEMKVSFSLYSDDHLAWYDYWRPAPATKIPVVRWLLRSAHENERRAFLKFIDSPTNKAAIGPRTLELTDCGVREFADGFDFTIEWKEFVDVVLTKSHLFIVHPTLNAHVVPTSAFGSKDLLDRFLAKISEKAGKEIKGEAGRGG